MDWDNPFKTIIEKIPSLPIDCWTCLKLGMHSLKQRWKLLLCRIRRLAFQYVFSSNIDPYSFQATDVPVQFTAKSQRNKNYSLRKFRMLSKYGNTVCRTGFVVFRTASVCASDQEAQNIFKVEICFQFEMALAKR